MSHFDVLFVAAGLFFAGAIKGLTGIGFSTCALPFLVVSVGLERGMAIVTLPAMASNVALLLRSGPLTPSLSRFWPFYVAIVPGIPLGTVLLSVVDAGVASQALGLVTAAYVGLALWRPELSLSPRLERRLAVPAGLANGLLTGLTGSQILPLMPYMMSLRLSHEAQVQAVNIAVTGASGLLVLALLQAGLATAELLAVSALGVVPAIGGVWVGERGRRRLPAGTLRLGVLATLMAIAVSLVVHSAPAPKGANAVASRQESPLGP